MPRNGFRSWSVNNNYGRKQRNAFNFISDLLMGEQCKEIYSLQELRTTAQQGGVSPPVLYRALEKLESEGLIVREKCLKTNRVTIRNLLR
jgi:DNA-binding MarR family transcriptional regulator